MRNALRGQFSIQLPDGTEVGVLLNMYAVNLWCEETGHTLTDLDDQLRNNIVQALPGLTWAGARTYYELEEEEPPVTEKRYKILLGSTDWEQIAVQVAQALRLDDGEESPKKKKNQPNP